MKANIIVGCVSILFIVVAGAATLWQADFESPDYTLGPVVGQQGWSAFSGSFGSDGQVVNNIPGDVIPQGTQCLRLPPPGLGDYVMVRTKVLTNELAGVDVSNEFVKISYKMRPDTTYDALDIRTVGGTRMILFAAYPDGLQIATPSTPVKLPFVYSNWHDVFIMLDPLNNKVVQFGLDSAAAPVNTPFNAGTTWPVGYLRFSSQVTSPAPSGSGIGQCYFDDIRVETVPAGPVVGVAASSIFIGTHTRSGVAGLVNSGRPGTYSWNASTPNAWITIDPAATNGTTSAASVSIPFMVDKSMLNPGETNGVIVINCGAHGVFTVHVTVRTGAQPAGIINVAGLHLTQISPNAQNEKYYQDTMIQNLTPRAAFDGGQMDVGVLRGWYGFGNTAFTSDPYVGPHLVDGPALTVNKGAFATSNTVYALNTNVYEVLNPVIDNGTTPVIAGDLAAYIAATKLTKQELAMPLYEGTNRFTLLAPSAMEIGDQGMIGLFVYGSNETPNFVDGMVPTLAAVDDNSGDYDAEGYFTCGYFGGDVAYFQKATNVFTAPTLMKEIDGYVVRITYFNLIGRNSASVNPYGMTGPACVGHVCPYLVGTQWAIRNGSDHAIGYLEIVVSQPPPVPAAFVTNLSAGAWQSQLAARVYNVGSSNFAYTAMTDASWLSIAPGFASGVVSNYHDIQLLVNRTGLSNGFYTGHLLVNCGALNPSQLVFNVRMRVGTPGVINVYGLHVTEVMPDGSQNKKYQDTMFANATPNASFDANIDIAVLQGIWGFGNTQFENDAPWLTGLLSDGAAQYVAKGSFLPGTTNIPNAVKALDPAVYPILNPVTDNGTAPVVNGNLAAYLAARQVEKNDLFMTLHEGVNRFTIILGPLGEITTQGMLGMYLFASNQPPAFAPGSLPTIAGIDVNDSDGVMDAEGFLSCGFISGDAGYTQKATNMFTTGTLTNTVGDYIVALTRFDLVGPDTVNAPLGLSGPNCPGNVCDYLEPDFNSQWAIRPGGNQYLGYIELTVELIPEPSVGIGLVALAALLQRRR